MKKKLMVLLASAMVLASLAGCGNNNAEEASGASSEAEETAGAADPAMESTDGTAGEEEVEKPGEEKTELVIAGGDAAGVAAAIQAVSEGMDPSAILIVESGDELAADAAGKGSFFNESDSDQQFEAGIEDSYDSFLADTRKAGGDENDTAMAEFLVESASEARVWLEGLGVKFGAPEQREGSSAARSLPGAGEELGVQVEKALKARAEELKIPVRYNTSVVKLLYGDDGAVSGIVLSADGKEETIDCLAVVATDPELLPLFEELKTVNGADGNAAGVVVTSCAEAIMPGSEEEEKAVPGLYAAGRIIEAAAHGAGALEGNEMVSMAVYGMTAGTEAAIYIGDASR